MTLWQWLWMIWNHLVTLLQTITRNRTNSFSTVRSSVAAKVSTVISREVLLEKIYGGDNCDLHDVLSENRKTEWPEWHLVVKENEKATQIAEQFIKNLKKSKLSSSIVDHIKTIEETFLEFQPIDNTWNRVKELFTQAREENNPELAVKAYSSNQEFTKRLNRHLAANSKHFLTLYCTALNCPILDRTQDYTDAFTKMLLHPKFDNYCIQNKDVYRGMVIKDRKLIEDYKEGTTILTTTFLSASKDRSVGLAFCGSDAEDTISIFCTYHIENSHRRSALDIESISCYPYEKEVLILRYVPFTITSIKTTEDGRRINICLDEYSEETPKQSQFKSNNSNSIKMNDSRIDCSLTSLKRTRNQQNASCWSNEKIQLNTISGWISYREANRNPIASSRIST